MYKLLIYLLLLSAVSHSAAIDEKLCGKWGTDIFIRFNSDKTYKWQGENSGGSGIWYTSDSSFFLIESVSKDTAAFPIQQLTPLKLCSDWWPDRIMHKDLGGCGTSPVYVDITGDKIDDMLIIGNSCLEAFKGNDIDLFENPNKNQLIRTQWFGELKMIPITHSISANHNSFFITFTDPESNTTHRLQFRYRQKQLFLIGEEINVDNTYKESRNRLTGKVIIYKNNGKSFDEEVFFSPQYFHKKPINIISLDSLLFRPIST